MSDVVISCTCCGYQLVFLEGSAAIRCPACHTHNARPRSTGDTLLTLQRAVDQRLACDFHNAELSYQQVLLYRPDEHEALWGRLLCHYGVEYVEDPVSKRRMPTVHTVQPKPLQEQADFRRACQLAPEAIRIQYEQDAAYIDNAQANIRQLARSCQPYDVFLCHKTTKPGSSDYTQDFHHATQLYHFLKDQGVRVFFAPECLQSAAGANYEAGIYHALHTAKVMLVVCTNADYLTSAWVRSEWARYLSLMDTEPNRLLIPLLYDHFDPSNLPQQFLLRSIQGLDMTDINAPQRLIDIVFKSASREKEPVTPLLKPSCAIVRLPPLHPNGIKSLTTVTLHDCQARTPILDSQWGETVEVPVPHSPLTLGISWGVAFFRKKTPASCYQFQIEAGKKYVFSWSPSLFNQLKLTLRQVSNL